MSGDVSVLLVPVPEGGEIECDIPGCSSYAAFRLGSPVPIEGTTNPYQKHIIRSVCEWHVETIKPYLTQPTPTRGPPEEETVVTDDELALSPAVSLSHQPNPMEETQQTQTASQIEVTQSVVKAEPVQLPSTQPSTLRPQRIKWETFLRRIEATLPNSIKVSDCTPFGVNGTSPRTLEWRFDGRSGEVLVIIPNAESIVTSIFHAITTAKVVKGSTVGGSSSQKGISTSNPLTVRRIAPTLSEYFSGGD